MIVKKRLGPGGTEPADDKRAEKIKKAAALFLRFLEGKKTPCGCVVGGKRPLVIGMPKASSKF